MMANHDVNSSRRENPHKYILYKPTITQIMMFLATGLNILYIDLHKKISIFNNYFAHQGFKELPANGVLLMYVSADGCFQTSKHVNDCK